MMMFATTYHEVRMRQTVPADSGTSGQAKDKGRARTVRICRVNPDLVRNSKREAHAIAEIPQVYTESDV
jgi:hypothetical protein